MLILFLTHHQHTGIDIHCGKVMKHCIQLYYICFLNFSVYIMSLVLKWILKEGGLTGMYN
jgi:hypothetical protein